MARGRAIRTICSRAAPCALAVFALAPAVAHASTIVVTTTSDDATSGDGQCSLRKAIASVDTPGSPSPDCAAPSAVGNTIMLGPGAYTLSIKPSGSDDNSTGDLNIAPTVTGLTIEGSPAGPTTVDATGLGDRILSIASGASVTLTGLTLTGGRAPAGLADTNADGGAGGNGANGGAIDTAGTLEVSDSVLTDDDAGAGGQGGAGKAISGGGAGASGGTGGVGGSGGGIFNTGALTLDGTTFNLDHAGAGGQGGTLQASGATGGTGGAGGLGGGLFNGGTAVIGGATFTNDGAGAGGVGAPPLGAANDTVGGSGGAGGAGGGIYTSGMSLQISDSTLSSDTAGSGAAGRGSDPGLPGASGGCGGAGGGVAAVGAGDATIAGTTLDHDEAGNGGAGGQGGSQDPAGGPAVNGGNGCAGGSGGGIVDDQGGTLSVTNSTLTSDFAAAGGAGGQGGDVVAVNNKTGGTGGNGAAGGSGGALQVSDPASVTLLNVTIAQNGIGAGGASGAGGLANQGGATGGTNGTSGTAGSPGVDGGVFSHPTICFGSCVDVILRNTIVADNQGGNCVSLVADGGHDVTFGDIPPSCPGTNADPRLGQLADNGGPTETLDPAAGSAAIDTVPAKGASCPQTDQRGLPRPFGSACDAGAYEVTSPSATTGAASAVTNSGATVHATVTANAGSAAVHFDFGTTAQYGQQTSVQDVVGLTPATVSGSLTGLGPGTTYHYRVVAVSADGTTDGSDETFTTSPPPPAVNPAGSGGTGGGTTSGGTTSGGTTGSGTSPGTGGGGRSGGTAGAGGATGAVAAPALSGLALTPTAFAARSSGAAIAPPRRGGTRVAYSDTEAATTTFDVSRLLAGVRSGRRCVTPPQHPSIKHASTKHPRPCTRVVPVGSFSHLDRVGANGFTFTGRLRGHKLPAGGYQLAATPRAHGATGTTVSVSFRIVAS